MDAPPESQVRVVLSTVPSLAEGERLGRALVEERLAACVNVVPGLVSIYRWEGTVQRDEEALMIVKTTAGSEPVLRPRLVALHPYDVPEVVAFDVSGHEGYLEWVRSEVGAPS